MNVKNSIIEAGQQLKTVLITYIEKDGSNEGWREIEPYSFRPGNIFYGYDIKKGGIRSFKLERIVGIKITDNSYIPQWEVEF